MKFQQIGFLEKFAKLPSTIGFEINQPLASQ
jgi:hypothetical protein